MNLKSHLLNQKKTLFYVSETDNWSSAPEMIYDHGAYASACVYDNKIFVFGAEERVNKQATENLKLIYQGISIVGRCNGYLPESKMEELIKKINDSGADILFIALGSPKQENWIEEHLPLLRVKVCQGVGGSLDIISGKKKRAPAFIQKIVGYSLLFKTYIGVYKKKISSLFIFCH